SYEVVRVVFSPDGQSLASGSVQRAGINGEVKVWDVATGRERFTPRGRGGGVYDIAFSPDGKRFVAAIGDFASLIAPANMRFWDTTNWDERLVIPISLHVLTCVAFSPDGKYLATGEAVNIRNRKAKGGLYLWQAADGRLVRVIRGHDEGYGVNHIA